MNRICIWILALGARFFSSALAFVAGFTTIIVILGASASTIGQLLADQMDDLIDGAVRVGQGGVVRLAQLQQEGYLYLRP